MAYQLETKSNVSICTQHMIMFLNIETPKYYAEMLKNNK